MEKSTNLSLILLTVASCCTHSSHASIIINEFDYDQAGSDTAEFIELFNSGDTALSLENYSIDLINGANLSVYRSIELSSFSITANGYFVVCGDASLVANCDYSFTTTSGWIQNGSPDAIRLSADGNLQDFIAYEGVIPPYTLDDALTVADNNHTTASISRFFDNSALSYNLGCITPGTQNIAGSGDCSTIAVSPVPVPAAVWLFGTGLLGLTGFARRK